MSELEDKISSVLSNPAEMEKIAQIAKTLMAGGFSTSDEAPADSGQHTAAAAPGSGTAATDTSMPNPAPSAPSSGETAASSPGVNTPGTGSGGLGGLADIASSLGNLGGLGDIASGLGNIDPKMLASLGKMLGGSGSSGPSGGGRDNTALLQAMGPYLSEKRRNKMAQAIQIAKMARIAGVVFSDNS